MSASLTSSTTFGGRPGKRSGAEKRLTAVRRQSEQTRKDVAQLDVLIERAQGLVRTTARAAMNSSNE